MDSMILDPTFDIGDLQPYDYAMGGVVAGAFERLSREYGTAAWRRFLKRPVKDKIFLCRNDDVQEVLAKIAQNRGEPAEEAPPDLPCIVYYRDRGLVADQNQFSRVHGVPRLEPEAEPEEGMYRGVHLTTVPVTLTYSIVFLAWDRATLERMEVAWWTYAVPLGRRTSFKAKIMLDGEVLEVPAHLTSPREINSGDERLEDGRRIWGARTMAEFVTQALRGGHFDTPEAVRIEGGADRIVIPRVL